MIRKLAVVQHDLQHIESSVSTVATFPIPCPFLRIRGFAIDAVRGNVALVFSPPEGILEGTLKLIVIFNWVSDSGVVLDTKIPCVSFNRLVRVSEGSDLEMTEVKCAVESSFNDFFYRKWERTSPMVCSSRRLQHLESEGI